MFVAFVLLKILAIVLFIIYIYFFMNYIRIRMFIHSMFYDNKHSIEFVININNDYKKKVEDKFKNKNWIIKNIHHGYSLSTETLYFLINKHHFFDLVRIRLEMNKNIKVTICYSYIGVIIKLLWILIIFFTVIFIQAYTKRVNIINIDLLYNYFICIILAIILTKVMIKRLNKRLHLICDDVINFFK